MRKRYCDIENHSLRIGGATANSNDPACDDFVAGCAGLWTSDCKFKYFHNIREKLESGAYSVSRDYGRSQALRPGTFKAGENLTWKQDSA